MITTQDQILLSNILPLDPRICNIVLSGSTIKVETIPEYLDRVQVQERYIGMDVTIITPPGTYDIETFLSNITLGTMSVSKYGFINTSDLGLSRVLSGALIINDLVTGGEQNALSAEQGKVLKGLIDGDINDHIQNISNPHQVTKSQIGLSNVLNIDTTTTANISDSNSSKKFTTQADIDRLSTTSGVNSGDQDLSEINNHILDDSIHYSQENISITESQISDLQDYELADPTILKEISIGVTIQPFNVNTVTDANYIHTDNNFTTIERDKLAGIESGATRDQTKQDIDSLGINAATVNNHTVETSVPVGAVFTDTVYDSSEVDIHIANSDIHYLQSEITIEESQISDLKNYLLSETDPIFTNSPANDITLQDITNLSNLSGVNSGDSAINITSNAYADSKISNIAYSGDWELETSTAASKKSIYDKIENIISTIPTQYTDELAQDAIGNILDNGLIGNIVLSYNDETPSISGYVNDVTPSGASGLMSGLDKTKLDTIQEGAEVNVQSNWNELDENSDSFISGKPTLSDVALSGEYSDILNAPSTIGDLGTMDDIPNGVTYVKTENNFSDTDKTKLDSLENPITGDITAGSNKISITGGQDAIIGSGVSIDIVPGNILHSSLSEVGLNSHSQIDSHISNTSNPHTVTKEQVGLGNVPNLDFTNASNITNGTLPTSVLPSIAITEVNVVNSEASQLALIAESGDVAVRTDVSKTYIHNGGTSGTITDWTELQVPSGVIVSSVNGEIGTVVLTQDHIENGTTYGRLTNTQISDLTDSGESTLHYHSSDRNRANHTGTQTASTISDFDIEVSNNTSVSSNTTHRTSTGEDHSYINQSVTTSSTPEFRALKLTTGLSNPSHSEGLIFYDNNKKAPSYYNPEADVTVNLGQENIIRVYNNSGQTIENGRAVYPTGNFGGVPSIGLADSRYEEKSRIVAIATHPIENNSYGYVTKFGEVGGLDTSMYSSATLLYLNGQGLITNLYPDPDHFIVIIGTVGVIDNTNGTIVVDTRSTDLTRETSFIRGWSSYLQGEHTTLSFNDGTRTLSIAPVGADFRIYQGGIKYILNGTQQIVISNVEGIHLVYFDAGLLYEIVNPTTSQISNILRNKVSVSVIAWNATNNTSTYVSNERHTIYMSSAVHAYLHTTRGTQYTGDGLTPTDVIIGNGSLDSHAQFGIDSGSIADEDIITTTPTISSTTGLPIYYRIGTNWRRSVRTGYSFLNDGTSGLVQYNKNTAGVWSLLTMTNNYYSCIHVYATNDIGSNKVVAIMGVNEYSSESAAEAAISAEVLSIKSSGFIFAEAKHIATFIIQTKSSFSNTVKAAFVATINGGSFVDFRTTGEGGIAGVSGNSTSFLALSDTPSNYSGHSNNIMKVGNTEQGIDFSLASVSDAGSINIPTGESYKVNNVSIVEDLIVNGVISRAPSQNAVYDALALKEPTLTKGNLTSVNTKLTITGGTSSVIGSGTSITVNEANFVIPNITQITNRSHTSLTDIGSNTHSQIDTHIASTSNPHSVTYSQVGAPSTSGTNATGTWPISVSGRASNLSGYYTSGGTEKPNNAIFGSFNLRLAMLSGSNLGFGGTYNDVLWLSSYGGTDVKGSYALIFNKYSEGMYYAKQDYDSASWGTGRLLLDTGNYNSYVPTLTGTGASGTWGINISGNSTTATTLQTSRTINGTYFNGSSDIKTTEWVHSLRDFTEGTLITTSIDYSVLNGDPFILEMRGNSYGSLIPFNIQIQGYIYNGTIINYGGYATVPFTITAMNVGGNLCFWFANQGYWQGFNVRAYSAIPGYAVNKVVSITNVANPNGTKQVTITPDTIIRSGNYNLYSPTLAGVGASGTWGISITGNSGTVTNGVYTSGSYSNPAWLTSLAGSKVSGNITGNAANITSYTINQSLGTSNSPTFTGLTLSGLSSQGSEATALMINGSNVLGYRELGTLAFSSATIPSVYNSTVNIIADAGLSGGGSFTTNQSSTGNIYIAVDLNELTTSTTDGDGDYFVVVDTSGVQKKLTKANINLSGFSNNSGWTSNTGTVTSVAVSNGGGLVVSGSPITTSGTITLSHSDTSSQATVSNSGRTYIQSITLDTYGHITAITSATETVVDTNTWRGINDTPVNGATAVSISSNWAYNHTALTNPHGTTYANVGAPSTTGTNASGTWGISVTGTSSNITSYTINQNVGSSDSPLFNTVKVGNASNYLSTNSSNLTFTDTVTGSRSLRSCVTEVISLACSDETSNLATGTNKAVFRMPFAMTLTAVRASLTTATAGSALIVDINSGGTSILSTKLSIDATEKTSTTAASAAVISTTSLADDAEITIDIDQIGSTTAGTGLKVYLIGYR